MSWVDKASRPRRVRCDECGQFIPLADLVSGDAVHRQVYPDSDQTKETDESLCKKCQAKEQKT